MAMPEASVNQNRLAMTREHNVRAARKILAMETKAVAHAMKQRTHSNFWLGILASDPAHESGPSVRVDRVQSALTVYGAVRVPF